MIIEDQLTGETQSDQGKRKGRKPKNANYFDIQEENAVRLFISSQSYEEKNKIYNEFLKKPLDKMISSIIRRYKLYRKDMDFDEIHVDTHSFLMTKIDKFKPSKEKKAYSYLGTICKNYLMGQIIKDQKDQNRKISYEDISSSLENDPQFVYEIDEEVLDADTIIVNFKNELKIILEKNNLSENEYRLGLALHDIFENHNQIFIGTSNNKFNKNIILLSLREMTNLSTKEIRTSLKKFKKIYYVVLQSSLK
jgi:hypothetical protein